MMAAFSPDIVPKRERRERFKYLLFLFSCSWGDAFRCQKPMVYGKVQ
jgi:hypothetical protein